MKKNHKSLIINRESQNLKSFVNDWDFANPNWESLPPNFPNLPKFRLTKEEGHLLDGIKLAWSADIGRSSFYKQTVRKAVLVGAFIFAVIAGGNLIISRQTSTNTVNAKTVGRTVGDIIEATRSAIFRK